MLVCGGPRLYSALLCSALFVDSARQPRDKRCCPAALLPCCLAALLPCCPAVRPRRTLTSGHCLLRAARRCILAR